jgi:hypothetical protein
MGFRAIFQHLATIHEASSSLLRELENPQSNRRERLVDFTGKILAAAQKMHDAATKGEIQ